MAKLTLTQEALDDIVAKAVAAALSATQKQPKQAVKVSNEAISEEEVAAQSGEFFYNIKEGMIARNNDGSIKLGVGKKGQDVVILKKGFDYGVYRFVKGVARQMGHMTRDGNWIDHGYTLSAAQVGALYNVLNRDNMRELFEAEEAEEVKPEPVKRGRPKKSAA